ncbi:MAG: hypothetical protein ACXVCY_01565 [Pseudobdellovibrionaceae bacterium]
MCWRVCVLLLGLTLLSACSVDVSTTKGKPNSSTLPSVGGKTQTVAGPDFFFGEIVTTTGGRPGYQVQAVFGELSEKTTSLNGNNWQVEGSFYE